MYVSPASSIKVGSIIKSGSVIGKYQTLVNRYPGITDHVHVEIKKGGSYIDPVSVIP